MGGGKGDSHSSCLGYLMTSYNASAYCRSLLIDEREPKNLRDFFGFREEDQQIWVETLQGLEPTISPLCVGS